MKTVISVKVDREVKASAQRVAKSAGISLSSLVNAYLQHISATRRIELFAPEPMTEGLERLIRDVEAERNAGEMSPLFATADEFLEDLKR